MVCVYTVHFGQHSQLQLRPKLPFMSTDTWGGPPRLDCFLCETLMLFSDSKTDVFQIKFQVRGHGNKNNVIVKHEMFE